MIFYEALYAFFHKLRTVLLSGSLAFFQFMAFLHAIIAQVKKL